MLPTSHSAVMIIIGAHTELCLTAAILLVLPLVPSDMPREVMPENKPTIFYIEGFPQAACRTSGEVLILLYIYSIFTSEYICRKRRQNKKYFQHVGFTLNVMQTVDCLRASIALY